MTDGILWTLRRRQRLLWAVAVVFYGVGDAVTTAAGLASPDAVEAGPVATLFLGIGDVAGIAVLKVVLFACCFALWRASRSPGRVAVPLALAVVGVAVTAWNVVVLAT